MYNLNSLFNSQEPIEGIVKENFKAYYLIRSDLNMSIAKIGVQIGHGTDLVHLYKEDNFYKWVINSRKKIVLKIKDEKELLKIASKLSSDYTSYYFIEDNGLTELNGKTITGLAIQPIAEVNVPKYIKRLQLFT